VFSLTDRSLYVEALDLWIDSSRRRNRCFVSHGHADHARPHATILATPESARLCALRFSGRFSRIAGEGDAPAWSFEEHRFNEPWTVGNHRLTLFSAGHVLGSAQLMIEGDHGSFVYTGDFKLEHSYTAEPAEVKRCDVVLMECTYGRPRYLFPPRREVEEQIVAFAARALEDDAIPLFLAYSLGKAQEAIAILGKASIPPTVHPAIAAIADVYVEAGISLPSYERYDPSFAGGRALLWPPGRPRPKAIRGKLTRSAVLTGWALDPNTRYRLGCEAAFPLSDHADFRGLLRYIELAQPKKVLLNHGPREFADHLRRYGVEADYLEENPQLALFT